jgi:signal transduction histidine kinase
MLRRRPTVQEAVSEERARIARELHDGVAQEVLHLLTQARRLRQQRPGPEADLLVACATRALDESRSAISTLRAPLDEPLPAALQRLGGELGRRLELDVSVRAAPTVAVAPPVSQALVRIVGEALVNAARHGHAHAAEVELREGSLLVRDDGCGFDPDVARLPNGAFGIATMRERAAAVGGRLTIRSQPGAGTELQVTLP